MKRVLVQVRLIAAPPFWPPNVLFIVENDVNPLELAPKMSSIPFIPTPPNPNGLKNCDVMEFCGCECLLPRRWWWCDLPFIPRTITTTTITNCTYMCSCINIESKSVLVSNICMPANKQTNNTSYLLSTNEKMEHLCFKSLTIN